jgi:hypothetical protein
MKKLLLALSITASLPLTAQTTWVNDVLPIFYNKCLSCHNTNGVGANYLKLETYTDAYNNRYSIGGYTMIGKMPPWPPDTTYSQLKGESHRTLTSIEIQTIQDWINQGGQSGDTTQQAPLPVFPTSGTLSGTPDLIIQIPPYTVDTNGLNGDDMYRCFVIPGGLINPKFIKGIDIVPKNHQIVHHVLMYYDTTGQAAVLDQNDPDPGYTSSGGVGVNDIELLGAWTPGTVSQFLPNGMGIRQAANGDFILQIHYPSWAHGLSDTTFVKIYYTPNNFVRRVYLAAPLEHFASITNGPLVIPPNSTATFYEQYQAPVIDLSLLWVAPHMHLVGTKIKSWAVTPQNQTIPFINIENWDFRWQGFYSFQKLIKLPANSMLYAEALYDNTTNNPNAPNPNNWVLPGEATDEEMMMVFFAFLAYFPGDENIILDSTLLLSQNNIVYDDGYAVKLYPNPAKDKVNVEISGIDNFNGNTYIDITDLLGKTVYRGELYAEKSVLDCTRFNSGVYIYKFIHNNTTVNTGKLVVSD